MGCVGWAGWNLTSLSLSLLYRDHWLYINGYSVLVCVCVHGVDNYFVCINGPCLSYAFVYCANSFKYIHSLLNTVL